MLTYILRLSGMLCWFLGGLLLTAGCAGGGADGDDALDPDDPHPVASLEAFPAGGSAPVTITFDATGCWARDGGELVFDWDFDGDGNYELSGGTNLEEHEFSEPGEYNTTLRVTDSGGLSSTASLAVTITDAADGGGGAGAVDPVASLITYPDGGAAPITITLDASGSWARDGKALTYEYDFDGDGSYDLSTAEHLVEHSYETAGTFTPRLRVTDGQGHSTEASAEALTITAGSGGGSGGSADPVASLLAYPLSGAAPLEVTLDASGSWAKDGKALTYEYDFDGDGTYDETSNAHTVEHTYTEAGTYTPGLRVTDGAGHSSTAEAKPVVVSAGSGGGSGGSADPVASLRAYPLSGNAPLDVTLDASGSWAKDGQALSYEFDFDGDGSYDQTSTTYSIEHTYTEAGTYNPKLRVTDSGGHSSLAEASPVVVTAGSGGGGGGTDDDAPVAVVVANPTFGPPPLTVQFDANLSLAITGSIVSYDWDLDNDGTFELLNAGPTQQRTYNEEGFFYITVRVTDSNGLSATQQAAVVVNGAL